MKEKKLYFLGYRKGDDIHLLGDNDNRPLSFRSRAMAGGALGFLKAQSSEFGDFTIFHMVVHPTRVSS